MTVRQGLADRVRFDRREFSGSFGDIGTDLPLLVAMIAAADLDPAAAFALFGIVQIATGFLYGLPMPMQPLKAMAVIVIAGGADASTLHGAGLAIGVVMLALAFSGALGALARIIPKEVVRGIQLGLALALAGLALRNYIPADGPWGAAVALACFLAILVLRSNKRFPPALPVLVLGIAWALWQGIDAGAIRDGFGFTLPGFASVPSWSSIATGFIVLALPQIPLSLSNSLIATEQTVRDLFPAKRVSLRGIGTSYGAANIVVPFFGGIPVCHGCGGLAGHYAMGARTGGSVVIYGGFYLAVGVFFSGAAGEVVRLFPYPILGAVLLYEALNLGLLARDCMGTRKSMGLVLLVAVVAANAPQGFVIGMVLGCVLWHAEKRASRLRFPDTPADPKQDHREGDT